MRVSKWSPSTRALTHDNRQMLWESKGFIETCTSGADLPQLAVKSSPEEWAETGRSLFDDRNYLQGMRAFERANMAREAKIAYSYHLREKARLIPATKESLLSRQEAFRAAAVSFSDCAGTSTWKEARVLLHNSGDCYEHAGNCGGNAEDFERAANAYTEAREYNAAVKLYRKIDMFDEAVDIIKGHRHEMDSPLVESVLEVARLFYFRSKEYK